MSFELRDFVHYKESEWSISEPWIPTFANLPLDEWGDKPLGDVRWFAVGDAWLNYCRGSCLKLGKYKYKYRLVSVCVDKPIRVIETRAERYAFEDEYRSTTAVPRGTLLVDWYRVAQNYAAVFLSDRACARYALDVDSLVVFDWRSVQVCLEETNEAGWLSEMCMQH